MYIAKFCIIRAVVNSEGIADLLPRNEERLATIFDFDFAEFRTIDKGRLFVEVGQELQKGLVCQIVHIMRLRIICDYFSSAVDQDFRQLLEPLIKAEIFVGRTEVKVTHRKVSQLIGI